MGALRDPLALAAGSVTLGVFSLRSIASVWRRIFLVHAARTTGHLFAIVGFGFILTFVGSIVVRHGSVSWYGMIAATSGGPGFVQASPGATRAPSGDPFSVVGLKPVARAIAKIAGDGKDTYTGRSTLWAFPPL